MSVRFQEIRGSASIINIFGFDGDCLSEDVRSMKCPFVRLSIFQFVVVLVLNLLRTIVDGLFNYIPRSDEGPGSWSNANTTVLEQVKALSIYLKAFVPRIQ